MKYSYRTKGTCAREISFSITGDIITNIEFKGGCDGNLKAVSKILDGWTVEQIEAKLTGNTCGGKTTSCADQLSKAVRTAYDSMVQTA